MSHPAKAALVLIALVASSAPVQAAEIIGILRDGSGPFYDALSTKVKESLATRHPSYRVVVSTPAANKMARCNSARRFAKVGCEIVVALGPGVARVTIEECDHPMVYGVYDVAPFEQSVEHATGAAWSAPPSTLLGLLATMHAVKTLGVMRGDPGSASNTELDALEIAAKKLGVAIVSLDAGLEATISTVDAAYYAGMYGGEPDELEQLSVLAMQARKPVVTTLARGTDNGALLAQFAEADSIAEAVVAAVDRVLGGAEPAAVPPVRKGATIVVNPSVARALGLRVSSEVSRAVADSVR